MSEQQEISYSELCQRASQKTQKQQEEYAKGEKEKKDHFMALRENVRVKLRELWHELSPNEYFILELLADATIDWKQTWKEIDLVKIADQARIRIDVCRKIVRKLGDMKLIIRVPKPRHNDIEMISLNAECFGQILINKQQKKDKSHLKSYLKDHLKLVISNVDNSSSKSTNHGAGTTNHGAGTTNHGKQGIQDIEIIDDPVPSISPSISSSYITLLDFASANSKNRGEIPSLSGGNRAGKRSQEEHEKILADQLEKLKAGLL